MPDDEGPAIVTEVAPEVAGEDLARMGDGRAAAVQARDVVSVVGPDAVTYLQGQLSQDIAGLALGASALSFVLEPQGRIVALARVHRAGEEHVDIDVDPGVGDSVTARLNRFKLRTKAELMLTPDVPYLVYRGPDAAPAGAVVPTVPGAAGWDLPHTHDVPDALARVPDTVLDALRVLAGVPAARDLDERAVPAETGLVEAAASFTKGCYTGQELVARMDSRMAQPPRHMALVAGLRPAPPVGARLETLDGKPAGTLTTVVVVGDSWNGLVLVPRAVGTGPVDSVAVWDEGRVTATVLA
jgi:folate-binding protein YgfZ